MNRVILPTKKIKIAAWIMMADGIIIFFSLTFYILAAGPTENYEVSKWGAILLIMAVSSILFLPFGFSLLEKKKWAWKASVVLFFLFIGCIILFAIYAYFKYLECLQVETSMMQYEWFKETKEQIKAYCIEDYLSVFNNLSSVILFFPVAIMTSIVHFIFYLLFPFLPFPELLIFNGFFFFFFIFLILLPLIFLFIDRKKYWDIVS